jgi:hypothetical protein
MKLTAETLVNALAAATGQEPADRAESVALVRTAQPSFAPTLYSAWRADGDDLNPVLRHDLDAATARIDSYRGVAARLAVRVPGLVPIKGLEVAALYPHGLMRTMNDLDYVAATERDVWTAVAFLVGDGWVIHAATFFRSHGALQIMVSLWRPHEDRYQLPYGFEIATYFALGCLGGVGPVVSLPLQWRHPPVKNLLMLLYERFEQPYRARDLVDAALLGAAITTVRLPTLRQAIAQLELSAQYTELAMLVDRCGLDPLPALRFRTGRPYASRARRFARDIGSLARPVVGAARQLQRRDLAGTSGGVAQRLARFVWPRIPVREALNAGLLAFGLPLDGPAPPVDSATLRSRGALAWIDTPVARFLLTLGNSVTQSAVDELTPRSTAATPTGTAP